MSSWGKIAHTVYGAGKIAAAAKHMTHKAGRALRPQKEEDVFTMKKSTLIAIVAFLSAVAGALAAAFVYLRRREAERGRGKGNARQEAVDLPRRQRL